MGGDDSPEAETTPDDDSVVAAIDPDDRLVIADITRDDSWLSMPCSEAPMLQDWR